MNPDQSTLPRRPAPPRRSGTSTATARSRARRVAGTPAGPGQGVATAARDRGQQVASTAVERSQRVAAVARKDASDLAGSAREQAGRVTDEVRAQGRQLVDDTRRELQAQCAVQAARATGSLRRLSSEAGALAEGRPRDAGSVGHYVEEAADRLDAWAETLDAMGVDGAVREAADFAKRRPAVFVAGAAVAGLAVGRLLRAGRADEEEAEDDDLVEEDRATSRRQAVTASRQPRLARAQ